MSTAAIVRTCEKTNIWLNELAEDLDWDDRDMAFRASVSCCTSFVIGCR